MNVTTVKHYRNSFLDIYNSEIRIWMDPWINTAFSGIWAGCKSLNFLKNELKKKPLDFIYLSHLHTDHFDIKLLLKLIKLNKKPIKFLVKEFKDRRLVNILVKNNINLNNIIEIKPYKIFNLSKTSKIILLPQISNSYTFSKKIISYDLDTSCIFYDNNIKIFNQVDNPYSVNDLKKILKKLKQIKFNASFDLSFLSYCGSSEYPFAYLNLNKKKEKDKLIKSQLDLFKKKIAIIESKFFIPAGGTYALDNIFNKLNRYLPIPKFKKILLSINKPDKKKIINTNKFYFISKNNKIQKYRSVFSKYFISSISNNVKNLDYNNIINFKFNKKKIKNFINNLENNLSMDLKKKYNKLKTQIYLNIYDVQPLKIKNLKKYNKMISHKIIFSKHNKKLIHLNIYFYYKAFLAFSLGKISFNNLQQHFLYKRNPNIYEPDALFFLNFYRNFKY